MLTRAVGGPVRRSAVALGGIMEMVVFKVLFVAALFAPPLALALGGLSLMWPSGVRPRHTAPKPAVPATL
jgi:hypothetical protein